MYNSIREISSLRSDSLSNARRQRKTVQLHTWSGLREGVVVRWKKSLSLKKWQCLIWDTKAT